MFFLNIFSDPEFQHSFFVGAFIGGVTVLVLSILTKRRRTKDQEIAARLTRFTKLYYPHAPTTTKQEQANIMETSLCSIERMKFVYFIVGYLLRRNFNYHKASKDYSNEKMAQITEFSLKFWADNKITDQPDQIAFMKDIFTSLDKGFSMYNKLVFKMAVSGMPRKLHTIPQEFMIFNTKGDEDLFYHIAPVYQACNNNNQALDINDPRNLEILALVREVLGLDLPKIDTTSTSDADLTVTTEHTTPASTTDTTTSITTTETNTASTTTETNTASTTTTADKQDN